MSVDICKYRWMICVSIRPHFTVGIDSTQSKFLILEDKSGYGQYKITCAIMSSEFSLHTKQHISGY